MSPIIITYSYYAVLPKFIKCSSLSICVCLRIIYKDWYFHIEQIMLHHSIGTLLGTELNWRIDSSPQCIWERKKILTLFSVLGILTRSRKVMIIIAFIFTFKAFILRLIPCPTSNQYDRMKLYTIQWVIKLLLNTIFHTDGGLTRLRRWPIRLVFKAMLWIPLPGHYTGCLSLWR